MARIRNTPKATRSSKRDKKSLSKARLDELVKEAIIDAYGESEQALGLFTMIEENLALPFVTEVLGVEVTVLKVDLTVREDIVAICKRGKKRQSIPILDLPLPAPAPAGWERIEAYRHWASGWR